MLVHLKTQTSETHFQTCSIDMAMGSLDRTTVTLIPDQLVMSQALDMPNFKVIGWTFESKPLKTGKQGISIVVSMKRKMTSEMMTTYLPSLLLTAITFATTFFKPFFFEAALSVNLTIMLVMTTIFISKMEGLPPTSDIKMIDVWLVLCQIVPFAEVILLTAMEYNREDKKRGNHIKKKGKKKTKNVVTTSVTVVPLNNMESLSEIKDGQLFSRCSIPSLKMLGMIVSLLMQNS